MPVSDVTGIFYALWVAQNILATETPEYYHCMILRVSVAFLCSVLTRDKGPISIN